MVLLRFLIENLWRELIRKKAWNFYLSIKFKA